MFVTLSNIAAFSFSFLPNYEMISLKHFSGIAIIWFDPYKDRLAG